LVPFGLTTMWVGVDAAVVFDLVVVPEFR